MRDRNYIFLTRPLYLPNPDNPSEPLSASRFLVFVAADPEREVFWAFLRAALGLDYRSDLHKALYPGVTAETFKLIEAAKKLRATLHKEKAQYCSDLSPYTEISNICEALFNGNATLVPVSPREQLYDKAEEIISRISRWHPNTDLILSTSGTSKAGGHLVSLSRQALIASANATHSFFQERQLPPGKWIIALPLDHIAGLQVAIRSELAGYRASFLNLRQSFTPGALSDLITSIRNQNPVIISNNDYLNSSDYLSNDNLSNNDYPSSNDYYEATIPEKALPEQIPLYLSLVPTQLYRCLDNPACLNALQELAAILLGGAACSPNLLNAAKQANLPIYTTYGMTETCGGCVYDGVALPGTSIRIEDERVLLCPPGLMNTYLEAPDSVSAPEETFSDIGKQRFIRTNDRGRLTYKSGQEILEILGRIDQVIISGGVNISLSLVQNTVETYFIQQQIKAQAIALGIPDPQWGQLLCLAYSFPSASLLMQPDDLEKLLGKFCKENLPREHCPKKYCYFPEFPLLENGKINLACLKELCISY